jgi:hypothetical protein
MVSLEKLALIKIGAVSVSGFLAAEMRAGFESGFLAEEESRKVFERDFPMHEVELCPGMKAMFETTVSREMIWSTMVVVTMAMATGFQQTAAEAVLPKARFREPLASCRRGIVILVVGIS